MAVLPTPLLPTTISYKPLVVLRVHLEMKWMRGREKTQLSNQPCFSETERSMNLKKVCLSAVTMASAYSQLSSNCPFASSWSACLYDASSECADVSIHEVSCCRTREGHRWWHRGRPLRNLRLPHQLPQVNEKRNWWVMLAWYGPHPNVSMLSISSVMTSNRRISAIES